MYKYIFFDLDGTLTDPGLGITNSAKYALKKLNIEVNSKEELNVFIGPPLQDTFKNIFRFSEEDTITAIKYFREYYADFGIYENEIYPNIIYVLEKLKKMGKKLVIATSKPEVFTLRVLEHFDLKKYFDFISAATLDSTRIQKKDIINYAINSLRIHNNAEIIMIGDRKHDIIGANENNIDSIGVLYGYGNLEEHKQSSATYIAETVLDILKLIY